MAYGWPEKPVPLRATFTLANLRPGNKWLSTMIASTVHTSQVMSKHLNTTPTSIVLKIRYQSCLTKTIEMPLFSHYQNGFNCPDVFDRASLNDRALGRLINCCATEYKKNRDQKVSCNQREINHPLETEGQFPSLGRITDTQILLHSIVRGKKYISLITTMSCWPWKPLYALSHGRDRESKKKEDREGWMQAESFNPRANWAEWTSDNILTVRGARTHTHTHAHTRSCVWCRHDVWNCEQATSFFLSP